MPDLHSRKIVGWAMGPQMPAALVCTALQMAIVQRNPGAAVVVYSDRGTQYANAEHQALLTSYGLIGRVSRKGNCWENVVMERLWQKDYANYAQAITDVSD